MFIVLDFLAEWIRVPIHQCQNRIVSFLVENLKVMAADTIASLACLIESEAVTVQFETLSFFAITEDFFVWVGLFSCGPLVSGFVISVASFILFF